MSTAKLRKVGDTFSERLKMLRLGRGWSQEDLAARLDVSAGSVGNWEMGPHVPHAKTLKKVAGLFEVDVRFLLQGERGGAVMRESSPEYQVVDLAGLLREIEGARAQLERVEEQLRRTVAKPSAAAVLTETAAATYEKKRSGSGAGKNPAKEASNAEAQRTNPGGESHPFKTS